MLYLSGISIALFLSFLLFTKKNKLPADKILATWLLFLGIHLLFYYLSFSGKFRGYPGFFGLHFPLPLLHGPFLYLYADALTKRPAPFKFIHFLHFIPAFIFYMLSIPFYLMPLEQKISIVRNGGTGYQPVYSIELGAIMISGFVYVLLTSYLLKKHRRKILNHFSNTAKVDLQWLQYLTYGIGLIWIFIVFTHDEIIFAVAALFILFTGYFGIRQEGIFTQKNPEINYEKNDFSISSDRITAAAGASIHGPQPSSEVDVFGRQGLSRKKYSKSGLTKETALELHKKLNFMMETEKLFKNSDLSLSELSGKLNTHPNYLSQTINEMEGKNFFDYVNTLRTREFMKIVSKSENQKYTLLGIAYDCGFNSKSSFNKYFKRLTGLSPSEYLDNQRKDRNISPT